MDENDSGAFDFEAQEYLEWHEQQRLNNGQPAPVSRELKQE